MKLQTKNILITITGVISTLLLTIVIGCNKDSPQKEIEKKTLTEKKVHYDYQNISKDVKYVGDEQCYDCHSSIYDSYKKTEMGRSYYRPNKNNIIEDYSKNNVVYDTATRLYYKMTNEDSNFYQTEYLLDSEGKKINELKLKVEYIVGSGMHTRSYISNVNGFLSEMPATWYILKKKWDLSPGFNEFKLRFTRPITKECMECHNSHSGLVNNTLNQYKLPVPEGIGCESCHGPGELHVKHHNEVMKDSGYIADKNNFIDRTIVNPSHLPDDLKMDVCSRCHLQGEQSMFKPGKSPDDFYPGMYLSDVKTVYLKDSSNGGDFTIASHTARLVKSECFKKGGGKIVCMYCHDPHVSVKDVPKQSFNDKCISCHDVQKLSQTNKSADHLQKSNCVKCHMLQGGVTDIPHVNFTDHWIRKTPEPLTANELAMKKPADETFQLRDFYSSREQNERENSGIAYVLFYEAGNNRPEYLYKAVEILKEAKKDPAHNIEADYYLGLAYFRMNKFYEAEEALKEYIAAYPQDSKGHMTLAQAYEKDGKFQNAINEYIAVNSVFPNNPAAFNYLGNAYAQFNKTNEAISAYLSSINLYPIEPTVYNNMANLYSKIKNMDSSIVYYQMALHYNPLLTLACFNLGNAYLAIGKDDEAEKCFNRVLELEPSNSSSYGNLSIIYQKKKDFNKAIFYAKKMLEINPNDPNGQKLLKSLEKQNTR